MHPLQAVIDIVNPPEPVTPPEEIDHTSYLERAGFHTVHTWEGFYDSDWGRDDRSVQLVELVKVYVEWLNALGVKDPWREFRAYYDATLKAFGLDDLGDEGRYYSLFDALGHIAQNLYLVCGEDSLIRAITEAGTQALVWLAHEHEHSPHLREFQKATS